MNLSIDIIIVGAFLLINLIAGFRSGTGIKNIKEYAIGNRNFSTAAIAATIVATWIGGSSFAVTTSESYSRGLYFIIPGLGDAISFFIISYFYIPRMREFLGKLSVAEVMGDLYGKQIRAITAIFGIFPAIGSVAMQFSILGALLHYWLGLSGIYVLLMSSLVVLTYSAFGGIKSVTFTDMIQFLTFGIVTPMLAFIVWQSIDNPLEAFTTLKEIPEFNYSSVFNYHDPSFIDSLFLFLFFMIPGIDAAVFQRISIAKNTSQASRAFIIGGLLIIIIDLIINTFIGVSLKAANAPELDSSNVLGYIIDNYLNNGFKGLFIIGIMAMIMSTADSYINSSSVLFTHDFCSSMGINLTSQKQLALVRVSALLIGISGLFLSMFAKSLFDLMLSSYGFYMPIVSVPLILAIFGFRSNSKSVLTGMLAGFVTVIWFKLFSEVDSIIPGMIANLVFFIGSHYLLGSSGGWVKNTDIEIIRAERKRKIAIFVQSIKSFNLITFCRQELPQEEKIQVYFGFFCMISLFSNLYSLPKEYLETYTSLVYFISCSVLALSTLFITYPFWLEHFKNESLKAVLWIIAIFYNLALSGSLFVIMSKFNNLQITILMANLVTVAVLTRWQVALLVNFTGIVTSLYVFKCYVADWVIDKDTSILQFKLTYILLLVSSILIAFLKPKQEHQALTEEQNEHLTGRIGAQEEQTRKALELKGKFIRNIQHEYHAPMVGISSMAEALLAGYDYLSDKQITEGLDTIVKSSAQLKTFDDNIVSLFKLSKEDYTLNKEEVDFSNLSHERIEICRKLYKKNREDREFILDIQEGIIINADKYYLTQVLDNLVINAISYCKQGKIAITLKQAESSVEFTITDEGIGIPQKDLEIIFEEFVTSSRTDSFAGGRGVGLALAKRVIEVHGGTIKAESDGVKGARFRFVLPLKAQN